jgi:hypothetical protein
MQTLLRIAAICAPAMLALPATAAAQPFKDRVITGAHAHLAQAQGPTARYPTGPDGVTIPITGDPAIAQAYATFLGTLPHGPELADLKVVIVPSADINSACGGEAGDGILACYEEDDQTMTVPADQTVNADGVTVDYVIAHEYGHHIAAHRSDAPLAALDFGPKRWASYELVCSRTLAGKLAPGDETVNYAYNPGEAWAETYAHLVFPNVPWRFTSLLKPTAGSLQAALADVTQPWTQRVSTTFTGTGSHTFKLPVTLDGAFTLQLAGPQNADYDLVLRSGGKVIDKTARPDSKDRIHYGIACRDQRTETLSVQVLKRSGPGGPYTVKATYAG